MVKVSELIESVFKANDTVKLVELFEHEKYKMIPGTKNSYREDPGNVTTKTLAHSHVYAKSKGKGNQLYSVNVTGTGHDGSSGKKIPNKHADHFRDIGYSIKMSNILECLMLNVINDEDYELIILED